MESMLSYYAGFVDGEGYIGIKKYVRNKNKSWCPMYSEKVSVAGVNKRVIFSLNDLVKGYMRFHKPYKLSKKGYWSWEITENKAKIFLRMIRPYLKVKGLDADLVLALSKNKEITNSKCISSEDRKLREDLYNLIKKLHTSNNA